MQHCILYVYYISFLAYWKRVHGAPRVLLYLPLHISSPPVHSAMISCGMSLTSTCTCSSPGTLCSEVQFLNHCTLSPYPGKSRTLSTNVVCTNCCTCVRD